MARKDDTFSSLSKALDEEFDYEKEIEEIERQEKELEARRRQKELEQQKKQEQAGQTEEKKNQKAAAKRPSREQKKEAEWLGEAFDPNAESPQPRRKKSRKGIIALVIILLLLICGGGAYFYKMQADEKAVADFEAKVASFQTENLDDAQLGDKKEYFDSFMERCKEAIDNKDLDTISQLNKEWSSMEQELTEATNGKMAIDSFVYSAQEVLQSYYVTDNYKEAYDKRIQDMNAAKDNNQFEKISSLQKSLDSLTTSLKAEDLKVVQSLKNEISEMDLEESYLTDSQKSELKKYAESVDKSLGEGNYSEAVASLNKWKSSASAVSEGIASKKAEEAARAESEAEELRKQWEAQQAAEKAAREEELRKQLENDDKSESSSSGSDGSYVFADSSSRYLTESELKGLSQDQLMYARNEIYARHGYIFRDPALKSYFESKSWYSGSVSSESFSSTVFNQYELANIKLIQSLED